MIVKPMKIELKIAHYGLNQQMNGFKQKRLTERHVHMLLIVRKARTNLTLLYAVEMLDKLTEIRNVTMILIFTGNLPINIILKKF